MSQGVDTRLCLPKTAWPPTCLHLDPTRTLVISQVVLSFGLPFAIVPLVIFTARRDIMGGLVNHRLTTIIASFVASIIVGLNIYLLYQTLFPGG